MYRAVTDPRDIYDTGAATRQEDSGEEASRAAPVDPGPDRGGSAPGGGEAEAPIEDELAEQLREALWRVARAVGCDPGIMRQRAVEEYHAILEPGRPGIGHFAGPLYHAQVLRLSKEWALAAHDASDPAAPWNHAEGVFHPGRKGDLWRLLDQVYVDWVGWTWDALHLRHPELARGPSEEGGGPAESEEPARTRRRTSSPSPVRDQASEEGGRSPPRSEPADFGDSPEREGALLKRLRYSLKSASHSTTLLS